MLRKDRNLDMHMLQKGNMKKGKEARKKSRMSLVLFELLWEANFKSYRKKEN